MLKRRRSILSISGAAASLLGAVSVACSMDEAAIEAGRDPQQLAIDSEMGEAAWPDEVAVTTRIADAIGKSVVDRYPPGRRPARRDAHPKAHGCVRAEFRVERDLGADLSHGVFVPGAVYEAWIRFSNGNGDPTRPDIRGDARGMAIKLMGVPGKKLLPSEPEAQTQDFVLISNPTFFANDPSRYATLVERGTSHNPFVALTAPFALGWKGLLIARAMAAKRIASPLETRYWSSVPFLLGTGPGRRAVKYSARPCAAGQSAIPPRPHPDYLREAMVLALGTKDACFEFLVQPRTAPSMSVEDSQTEWTEAEAPFFKVATIVIPHQIFDTPARDAFGENLSFTPWHSLPEHRPLGGVNRVRKVVYQAISEMRHRLNGTKPHEPSGNEDASAGAR
jgi:hypothetical protein